MQEKRLFADQMASVLDDAPMPVYVSAVDDQELLYANQAAENIFFEKSGSCKDACYHMAEEGQPCYFCYKEKTDGAELEDGTFRCRQNGCLYRFNRRPIDWDGRAAFIVYIFEAVEEKKEEAQNTNVMEDLWAIINAIPGGIASYRVEDNRFIPTFFSDGVTIISGHTRQEYEEMIQHDALDIVYELDRKRVMLAAQSAVISGKLLDVSYRMRHKNGSLIWIHLNGRRMGSVSESTKFYAIFTGMSDKTRLLQSIANETADGIYVIDKENYDLLYSNESKTLFLDGRDCLGEKCHMALHGKETPCEFCALKSDEPHRKDRERTFKKAGRFYKIRFRETEWNGIPSYVNYVRDVTEEIKTRNEKERLEQYFQTVIKNLPGGVAVIRCRKDSNMIPEFLSDGFAEMTDMSLEEAWKLYEKDAMAGVHPDDWDHVNEQIRSYVNSDDIHWEIVYRLKKGSDSYVWVKNTLSIIKTGDEESRVYAVYHEMTNEMEEQERVRQQYQELIMNHYRTPGPNALIVGHCNITQGKILDVIDYTRSDLIDTFGLDRECFFSGIATFIPDPKERQAFLEIYLNKPALEAFERGDLEQKLKCFIHLPKEARGRYVQIKVNMVESPDSEDITGILTITDITDKTIADHALHQLSVTGYDFVMDVDLMQDSFKVLSCNENAKDVPPNKGCFSKWTAYMLHLKVVPREREQYQMGLDPDYMREHLQEESSYNLTFSIADEKGDIHTKSMTVSNIDLRIGRVCLSRADVTDMLAAERQRKKELERALILAEEANQAKSDFLSSMSHDIRTPMNAIMGMTSLAVAHLGDQKRVADCLDKISISSKHLLSLINDVLDMSKIERSKIALNRIKISLPDVIQQLATMMKPQADEAGLMLNIRTKNILHKRFYGDPLRINQIFINILSNSTKFTQEGGRIDFLVEELESTKSSEYARYRFTDSDTGIGMPKEFLAHLFEPFTRGYKAESIEGTGLGLSITKGLVDLMEGEISVESEVNKGSIFRVELECEIVQDDAGVTEEKIEKTLPASKKERSLVGCRFLIAEDNEINAEILGELLHMYEAESVVQPNGRQAVEAFMASKPGTYDAILMDIQMPEMNGYEATRAIRGNKREDAQSIPIIAMTANAFAEDIQSALDAGMNAHVAKPIDTDVLWETLNRILDDTKK